MTYILFEECVIKLHPRQQPNKRNEMNHDSIFTTKVINPVRH